MFTNDARQKLRTGKYGTSRDQYLQDLVSQFQKATNEEFKQQIVAHLGNFAYDPFNYAYFRKLHVLDLFLDCLTEPNEKLVEFALAGICNCCPDPVNASTIVQNGGIELIISCITSQIENIVASAIATLYYLCTSSTKQDILTKEVLECLKTYATKGSVNGQIRNLAIVFLKEHVAEVAS